MLELRIPEAGESIQEVQIGGWLKQEGQWVEQDENVVELETDKASMELPAPGAGVLVRILMREGEIGAMGDLVGEIDETASRPESTDGSLGVERLPPPLIIMPAAQRLLAEHGLQARDVEATGPAGRLLKEDVLRHVEGRAQEAKSPPAALGEGLPTSPASAGSGDPRTAVGSGDPRTAVGSRDPRTAGRAQEEKSPPAALGEGLPTSPASAGSGDPRTAAASAGSGDPRPAVTAGPAVPSPTAPAPTAAAIEPATVTPKPVPMDATVPALAPADRQEEVVPMTLIRRRIAERLVQAQREAALLTTFNEIDMSAVIALRKKYRDSFEAKHHTKLGFMSFFVKAVIEALKECPRLNAEIRDRNIIYRNYYDIGVAIGGGKGLVVPMLRNAERMSFAEIESQIADFAVRARENKLRPEDLEGGTFTITNGGIYGSLLSTPIVNPPQSGVLGMHAIQERPVARNGEVVIRPMMYVALSYDHRVVDGREAVTFLKHVKDILEDPSRMLLEI